jgi:hypothetical protein
LPTQGPTLMPIQAPSHIPTSVPITLKPTPLPTLLPTTTKPSASPTLEPTTAKPSTNPTKMPSTAKPTLLPTSVPTNSPTFVPTLQQTTVKPTPLPTLVATTGNPTPVPTPSPIMPLTPSILECPSSSGSIDLVISGSIQILKTIPGYLCTLVQLESTATSFKPVGRSYEGLDWEPSSGEFASLRWTCNAVTCMVNLPSLSEGYFYQLTSSQSSDVATRPSDQYARFLEQASFGGNPQQIYSVNGMSSKQLRYHIAEWLKIQIHNSGITSHRAFFRQRMNSRMEVDTRQAAVSHPCQAGTRYRRFAISIRDTAKDMKVTSVGTKKVLSIDGYVRTVVEGPMYWLWDPTNPWPDGTYVNVIYAIIIHNFYHI